MKVFISQPMRGKTDEEIQTERDRILIDLKSRFDGPVIEIPSYFPDFYHNHINDPVYMLALSIKLLSDADLAVFAPGWDGARGCKIEHDVCMAYDIPYEEIGERA